MLEKLTRAWPEMEKTLLEKYSQARPGSYDSLFSDLIDLWPGDEYDKPDPDRITVIDHGDYQGTRVFVVGAGGYQPSKYWIAKVYYGSCSGCDAFEANCGWSDEIDETEARGNVTLAMHILQSIVEV